MSANVSSKLMRVPGTKLTLEVNPARWSARMYNAVIKSVETGVSSGGVSGDFAVRILQSAGLPYYSSMRRYYAYFTIGNAPEEYMNAMELAIKVQGGSVRRFQVRDYVSIVMPKDGSVLTPLPLEGFAWYRQRATPILQKLLRKEKFTFQFTN